VKRKYDLAISLGGSCSTTEAMRKAGLQWTTLPLDWTGGPGPRARIELIAADFEKWLTKSGLRALPAAKFSREIFMKDEVLGFVFNHDFTFGVPFDEDYERVKAKFDRRIRRLYKLMDSAHRILFLWLGVPVNERYAAEDFAYCRGLLRRKWPDKQFDFLYSEHADGVAFADRTDREADGVRYVTFDYRKREEGNGEWVADVKRLTDWLASEYEVRDYRTADEKRAWKAQRRKSRYRRYHADGFLDYLRTCLEYKLFRHLGKRLDKKGLI